MGNPYQEVQQALISLDCTEAIIDEAIERNCQLIISHHPIVFKGLKKFNGKNYVERVVIKAIQNNIALYAIHTNLDNVSNGVNKKIADILNLTDTRILKPASKQLFKLSTFVPNEHSNKVQEALFTAGAGKIGNYSKCSFTVEGKGSFMPNQDAKPFVGEADQLHYETEDRIEVILTSSNKNKVISALKEAHPYEEVAYYLQELDNLHPEIGAGMIGCLENEMNELDFIQYLKNKMQLQVIRTSNLTGKTIKKVALCGGSGSFLLNDAKANKADVYISADFKYHEFFDAENQLLIADIGHYESERYTIELLHDWLSEKFPTFALLKTRQSTNPINYL